MADNLPLSIVFGFRDRDVSRVKRCLDSLARQSLNSFEVIFVDYGSSQQIAQEVETLIAQYDFCRYIYSETRGLPWNRSQALNIGIRQARAHFLLTTDVDMVFLPYFLENLLNECRERTIVTCKWHLLPEGFTDWNQLSGYVDRFPLTNDTAIGGCMCAPTSAYQKVSGFDEYYCYWGYEDTDLYHRLTDLLGLEPVWLYHTAGIFHQWHSTQRIRDRLNKRNPRLIPDGVWFRMVVHYQNMRYTLKRNPNGWGRILTIDDRPALNFIDFDNGYLREDKVLMQSFGSTRTKSSNVLDELNQLPLGNALAIPNQNFPAQLQILRLPIDMINRVLGKWNVELTYAPNSIREFIADLVFDERYLPIEQRLISDYYLNFPQYNSVTLLVSV